MHPLLIKQQEIPCFLHHFLEW